MKRTSVSILLLLGLLQLAGCDNDPPGTDLDAAASAPDAAPVPDASSVDATPPDAGALCHRHTTGLLVGDSIVEHMYGNDFGVLTADGDAVYSIAISGATIANQVLTYDTSPFLNYPHFDWIWVQIGINNVQQNGTATDIETQMAALVMRLKTYSPGAKVIVGEMLPAKAYLDTRYATCYGVWQQVNAYDRTQFNAVTSISDAFNDGHDNLTPTADGLHPTKAGDMTEAMLLMGVIHDAFPDTPCP